MNKIYRTEEELLDKTTEALNVPFGEIDKHSKLASPKGGIGQLIEESFFEYKCNSDSIPDFAELGIELKVTPFKRNNKNIPVSKERLVLNIINYCTENVDDFYSSSFWNKNQKILMMFYEHRNDLPKELWFIDDFILYKWPKEDFPIILNDWLTIASKIKNGKAHELSESDTMYLAACTKGATAASSYRTQRFSDIKAKQRAYSLKSSYMTFILQNYVYGSSKSNRITKRGKTERQSPERLNSSTDYSSPFSIKSYISNCVAPFIGMTQRELAAKFNLKPTKSLNFSIIRKILKLNSSIKEIEEFKKANIIPKTIRLQPNGNIAEHMSFAAFNFLEIIEQNWEESDFYKFLTNTTFLFVKFQKNGADDLNSTFLGIQFWSMSEADVEETSNCWLKTKAIIAQGVEFYMKNGKICNNLPGSKENRISHVRPHTSNAAYRTKDFSFGSLSDTDVLPNGDFMTKQSFWLNNKYVKSILK